MVKSYLKQIAATVSRGDAAEAGYCPSKIFRPTAQS